MTGCGPFQAPPQGGAGEFFSGQAGGGCLSRETETRDPRDPRLLGRRGKGGGGGGEASEGLSSPPGGLNSALRKKGLQNI
jgi:hypothetical protein